MTSFFKFIFIICVLFFSQISIAQVQDKPIASSYSSADTTKANLLFIEAKDLINERNLSLAKEKAEESKLINQQIFGEESLKIGQNLHQIGEILYFEGKYEEAISVWKKSLEIREKLLSPNHKDIGSIYSNIGNALHFNGDFNNAIECHNNALEIQKVNFGENHLEVAKCYNNLGNSYRRLNNLDKSIELNKKALEVYLESDGNDSYKALSYNNLGNNYNDKGDYNLGLSYHEKALSTRLEILGEEHIAVADSYNNIGLSFDFLGKFDKAEEYHKKALKIRQIKQGNEHPNVGVSFMNLGTNRTYRGHFSKAISYYFQALGVIENSQGLNSLNAAQIYANMALPYEGKGDFDRAIEYSLKALKIIKEVLGNKHPFIALVYNNIGINYYYKEDFINSQIYTLNALNLRREIYGNQHPDVGDSYMNYASVLLDIGKIDLAISTLDTALLIHESLTNVENKRIAQIYGNFGRAFDFKGKLEKANDYHEKTLQLHLKIYGKTHPTTAKSYNHLANNFYLRGLFSDAEANYYKGLKSLNYYESNSFKEVNSLEELLYTFTKLSNLYLKWFFKTNNADYLKASHGFVKEGIETYKFILQNISSESKNVYSNKALKIMEKGIQTTFQLNKLTDTIQYENEGFKFVENSKSFLLYEALQESNALKFSEIPDSLLQKEYSLRIDISYYEKKRQEKLNTGLTKTDSTILEISGKLFDLNRDYENLKNEFETTYPKYYNAKYSLQTTTVQQVQTQLLQPNQTLLEYMVSDSSIFLFLIQKDNYEVHEIKKDFPLEDWVRQMTKEGIYAEDGQIEEQSLSNYSAAAQSLYEKLLTPVAEKLTEKLLIIPDGVLGYLPFEALLTAKPKRLDRPKTYPFLLHTHQISYSYSATLLKEMQEKQHEKVPENRLLAVAPFFRDDLAILTEKRGENDFDFIKRDSLSKLEHSGRECHAIANSWEGQAFYGENATADLFKEKAEDYQILHISTHAKADDKVGDYAYLAFGMKDEKGSFEKIYARDLYNFSLNADLVVLSACETGIGKLQKGEGIISMARAFAYAGAKSIFPTLWQVNDAKTKELMILFYENLKTGMTKDAALHKAKLDYLEVAQGNAGHPYFWAGLIGIGDMQAID